MFSGTTGGVAYMIPITSGNFTVTNLIDAFLVSVKDKNPKWYPIAHLYEVEKGYDSFQLQNWGICLY